MQFQYLTSKVLKLLNELKNEKRQQELNSIEKIKDYVQLPCIFGPFFKNKSL